MRSVYFWCYHKFVLAFDDAAKNSDLNFEQNNQIHIFSEDPQRDWDDAVIYDFLATQPERCDFDIFDELPKFFERYPSRPSIYRSVVDPNDFHNKTARKFLLDLMQNEKIEIPADFSKKSKSFVTFLDYVSEIMRPASLENLLARDPSITWHGHADVNENYWPFDPEWVAEKFPHSHVHQFPGPLKNARDQYHQDTGELSFSVGHSGSFVPFHKHSPHCRGAIAEVLRGRKRWFMTPDHLPPKLDINTSIFKWYHDIVQQGGHELPEGVETCVAKPGDLLFVPPEWWHATLNLGETVFMSKFLDDP